MKWSKNYPKKEGDYIYIRDNYKPTIVSIIKYYYGTICETQNGQFRLEDMPKGLWSEELDLPIPNLKR